METATTPTTPETKSLEPHVVETWDISKTYRTGFWLNQKVNSLKPLSIAVKEGETFGLLGPNGAGKTTLLKILLGVIRPTKGRGVLLGKPIGDRQTKQRIGYLPENAYFYDFLTAWEFLDYVGSLFQIGKQERHRRVVEMLNMVGLDLKTAKKKQLRQYSKGMLQRVGMAQALINDPEVVFLDEPMSGLDPLGRYQVREIILSLKAKGKTIFFNSHILADVELICDHIAILARGELLCAGSLQEVLGNDQGYQVALKGGDQEQLAQYLQNLSLDQGVWHGYYNGDPQILVDALPELNARLIHMNLARASLEDYFIRQLRERGITTSQ
jgi:ABC-2 type transport system ATP-binding protein